MQLPLSWIASAVVLGTAALAACGGGPISSTPGGGATPGANLTAVPLASLPPFDVTQAAVPVPVPASTDPGAAPFALTVLDSTEAIAEVDLSPDGAEIDPGTTVDAEFTDSTPTDAPAPTAVERSALASRYASAIYRIHIETVKVKLSQRVALKHRPTFIFTFEPGFLVGANYYLEYYDSSQPQLGWQDPFEGPAAINGGTTLLFTDTNNAFTFAAGVKYEFHLYAVSTLSSPTPLPATPTPAGQTPEPTPSSIFGLLTVSPTALDFIAGGQALTLSASEAGYSGTFTASVDDPTLATVTPSSGTLFTIVSTMNPGSSKVTIKDGQGQTVKVPFTVTITEGTIEATRRR